MPIRTFIAIEIPENIKENILQVIEQVKSSYPKIAWTKTTAYHLTLKFLGEVEENMIDPISEKIEGIAGNFTPFKIDVEGVGVFPNKRAPKILWAGLYMPDDSLLELQAKIEDSLYDLNFEKEKRKFKPHLTLGRVKRKMPPEFADEFFKCSLPKQTFTVDKIIVMKSELKPTGAVYTRMKVVLL
ncbi:MAG: RNA 2',3'-cyclic phosphodiesterase [Calditrichia bacterium]|nr:RNA 2',3'-cyclic phosphodiesterase [Calditrichia bacterium]